MSKTAPKPRSRYARIAPLAALGLFLTVLSPVTPLAHGAAAPTAKYIVITSVTSEIPLPDVPARPNSFIVRDDGTSTSTGDDFTVSFKLVGPGADGGELPASYNKAATVQLSIYSGAGSLSGTTSVIVPAGATNGSFAPVRISTAANQDTLIVAPTKGDKTAMLIQGVQSEPFDVLKTFVNSSSASQLTSIGGSDPDQACAPTRSNPVCAELLLPDAGGVLSSRLLSLGVCDAYAACLSDKSLVQALVRLDPERYTESSPATIVYKCDKSLCAGGGIPSYTLKATQSATGALSTVDPCNAKGIVNAGQPYCVDYVQSKRDNAGDLFLYLLFTHDLRFSGGP